MSDLKDWLARDVLIVGKLDAADEIYVPGCGYYQPDSGTHVIICDSVEPLHEVEGEEVAFSVDESLASENAKLRELLQDMWTGMCPGDPDCRMCAYFEDEYEADDGSFGHTGECVFLRRMHELGIEAD